MLIAGKFSRLFWLLLLSLSLTPVDRAIAQSIRPDNSAGTQVRQSGGQYYITGGAQSHDGANLFHSFEQFGLSPHEIATFLADPAVRNILGRVTGGSASLIDGLLRLRGSNANLYLMNPAGFIFGPNARLDLPASFTTTAATGIGFASGWFSAIGANAYADLVGTPTTFAFTTAQPGTILNAGMLAVQPGETLILLGGSVVNTGSMAAPGGTITLAAVPGHNLVRLSQEGFALSLEFEPLSTGGQVTTALPQPWTGAIAQLPQLLTGGDVQNATGVVVHADGTIRLTGSGLSVLPSPGTALIGGNLEASNPTGLGGAIAILGAQVGLLEATVRADGATGGGRVLIGGDRRGAGSVPTAETTVISANSTIRADAQTSGDGGSVIVWADNFTRFLGSISTQAGQQSGDGGFVEVSGRRSLVFQGAVSTQAPNGRDGTLLLDPTNIRIVAGAGSNDVEVLDGSIFAGDRPGETLTLSARVLERQLGSVTLEASNDITIAPGVSLIFAPSPTLSPTLTFIANADRSGGGDFVMDRTQLIAAPNRNVEIAGNNVTLGNISTLSAIGSGSSIRLTSFNGSITTGDLDAGSVAADAGGRGITLTATRGNINTGNLFTDGINNPIGGPITLAASEGTITTGHLATRNNSILIEGAYLLNRNVVVTNQNSSGSITFSRAVNGDRNLSIVAGGGNVTFAGQIGGQAPLRSLTIESSRRTQFNRAVRVRDLTVNAQELTELRGHVTTLGGSGQTYNSPLFIQGDRTLSGDEINWGSLVDGDGHLTLQPFSVGRDLVLGGASDRGPATLDLLASELSILQPGFRSITIGAAGMESPLTLLGNLNFSNPTLLRGSSITGQPGSLVGSNDASLTLQTTGNILLQDITTSGQPIILTSESGNIRTGSIRSSNLEAAAAGGNVQLSAAGDVRVRSIDTRGTTGGAIAITSGRFFQAVGQIPETAASLSTADGGAGGAITIRHGGDRNTPFIVGNAAQNGTAAAMTTGSSRLTPLETLAPITIRNNIRVFGRDHLAPPTSVPAPLASVERPQPSTDLLSLIDPAIILPDLVVDSSDTFDGTAYHSLERNLSTEFSDYFGFPEERQLPTLAGALSVLNRVQSAGLGRPALLYLLFVPAQLSPGEQDFGKHPPQDSDHLEIVLVTAHGSPIRRRLPQVTRALVRHMTQRLNAEVTDLRRTRSNGYLRPAQQLYQWLVAPIEVELQARQIQNLAFVMGSELRSIPVAALHNGQQFIIERYSVGLMPSLALTDTTYRDLRAVQILAMGASQFTDQRPLPAVPVELSTIVQNLWSGLSFLNQTFTSENLTAQRDRHPFGIVHLATHGEFRSGTPADSYIQFWDQRLTLNQMRQLQLNEPPVGLLVLSACRTALGNAQAELGFAGFAVQSGVQSVLASLWYVSDEGTLALMVEFYRQLRTIPIKAEALRRAQLALLRGDLTFQRGKLVDRRGDVAIELPGEALAEGNRRFSHPYYWASFTLVGSPW
ncbi:MAG TPA: CHAT domain-containing protein [Synechococcales cyanobacterium M55_K2018_004]|nr:CHAT domain-containing protein [Synechococcales cyanobacterium M55_K2018_004]